MYNPSSEGDRVRREQQCLTMKETFSNKFDVWTGVDGAFTGLS